MNSFTIGFAQQNSRNDLRENIDFIKENIEKSASQGHQIVAFPECCLFLGKDRESYDIARRIKKESIIEELASEAKKAGTYLLLGGVPEFIDEENDRVYNTSYWVNCDGVVSAKYRKLHLFDFRSKDLTLKESNLYAPGKFPTVVDFEGCKIGLTTCFDLRFPYFYEHLRQQEAKVIFVPSAFTLSTGKDHWLALLKARAIENQVYIIAPNQFGKHNEKRESYGKSCAIDPWGNIITLASEKAGLFSADIDIHYLEEIRAKLPVFENRIQL